MGKWLMVGVLILWPAASSAQESLFFRAGLVVNLGAQAADGVTTWQALARPGNYEANPAVRWATRSPWTLGAVKGVSAVAQTTLLRRLYRTKPKLATGLAWGLAGLTGYVAWRNHYAGRVR